MAGYGSVTWVSAVAWPLLLVAPVAAAQSAPAPEAPAGSRGCTVIYAADEDTALAAGNEDAFNPYTYVWFVPGEPGEHGRVFFGFEDGIPQAGVNEAGLFFDGLALRYQPMPTGDLRPVYAGTMIRGDLADKVMAEAATVAEALALLDAYSHRGMETYQLFYGDAGGNSAIVEGGAVLAGRGSFQIATNFRLTEHPDPPYPCQRYQLARGRLSMADAYTVDLFRGILADTHQEPPGPTLYSAIFDLRNGLIYLYLYHDFENVVILDVAAELAEGFHYFRLLSLFPPHPAAAAYEAGFPGPSGNQLAARVVPMRAEELAEYTGLYRVRIGEPGREVSMYLDGEHLYLHQRSSLPIELWPEGEDRFFHLFHEGNELTVVFERDDRGAVAVATGRFLGEWFRLERLGDLAGGRPDSPLLPGWAWVLLALAAAGLGTATLAARRSPPE